MKPKDMSPAELLRFVDRLILDADPHLAGETPFTDWNLNVSSVVLGKLCSKLPDSERATLTDICLRNDDAFIAICSVVMGSLLIGYGTGKAGHVEAVSP